MRSIRGWLLGSLICGFIGAGLIAGYGIFRGARNEAGELFDYELRVVAISLPQTAAQTELAAQRSEGFAGISDDRIAIQTWSTDGNLTFEAPKALGLPRQPPGLRTVRQDERKWRVYGIEQGNRFVQVAQPMEVRNALAVRFAMRMLWPLAVLLPVAALLAWYVVGKGLAPVARLSAALAARSADQLQPLEPVVPMPAELRPLVAALNDLLQRLERASAAQRTFVADAAHELRSPLTALKLQIQLAARDGKLSGHEATLVRLDERLNRTIHLVRQLLTMARADAGPTAPHAPVPLASVARQVVAEFSVLAEQKGLDLGFEMPHPALTEDMCVLGDAHSLAVLISNLVDNAIRHTPGPGRIDVILAESAGTVELAVVDDGPGIPDAELQRVFDRFYRGRDALATGSGLGLAIAQRVAERHGAMLQVQNRAGRRGLSARVTGLVRLPDAAVKPASAAYAAQNR